jgi:type I restriction enzyme, S subunit
MSFPRYPKYKDSGVEWLGEVPEHWEVRRLRQIGPLLKGCGGSKEDVVETGIPCVRYGDLYTTHAYTIRQARTCVTEERAVDYFPIRRGDVLFAASGEDLAEIGRSAVVLFDERACCGGDLVVLRPGVGVAPEFMGYACDCWVAKAQKASMGRGTTVKHIYPDELKRLLLALPTPTEQTAIAAFLDRETAKIDALIAEQQRLIELLQEKRQAVISHAVTKGLNPDVPMKDSGIEWLGEVPEHWAVCRVKAVSSFTTSGPRGWSERVGEEGALFVQSGDLNDYMEVDFANCKRVQVGDDAEASRTQLRNGDVVVCVTGAKTGNVAVCETVPEDSYVNQHVCLVRPNERVRPPFLATLLKNGYGQTYFSLAQYGLKQGLSLEDVREALVLLPPLDEQVTIVEMAADRGGRYLSLQAEARTAIALLQERRSALISAAVTGQIDVRNYSSEGAAA